MLPPPRPATSFRTVDYRELLNLKAQLGRYQFQSATLKAHLAHARELLDWISPRRWKEMQQVSTEAEKGRVSWTEAIGKYLQKAVANPRKTLPLFVGVLYQFKRICSARLKRQSCRPEGLGNLHRYVNALPEPSSDDIRCTKRALLRLQQRHFAKLFLHEDEHGSNIDTILSHLKETAFLIKGADNLLSEDATIEEENEAADCLDKADDQAKGICDLCQAVLGLDWVNIWNRQVRLLNLDDEFLIETNRSSSPSLPERHLSPPAHSFRHRSFSSFSPINRRTSPSMGFIDSSL